MFRGALDAMLLDQGYKGRTCGNKLDELTTEIAEGTAPSWAAEVDPDALKLLKTVADKTLHVDAKPGLEWANLNSEFVGKVETILSILLYNVYEREFIDNQNKQAIALALTK